MNYLLLNHFSLFNYMYLYVDLYNDNIYSCDVLLAREKLKVKFVKEMKRNKDNYRIIFCKVKKKDSMTFEAVMERLKVKMLITGHPEYDEVCKEIFKTMKEK